MKFITLTTDSGQVYVNPFHIVLMIATQGGKNANTFLGFSGGELSVNEETDVILGMIEKTYGPEA